MLSDFRGPKKNADETWEEGALGEFRKKVAYALAPDGATDFDDSRKKPP